MNKQIIIMVGIMFAITLVSAMYSGETEIFDLEYENCFIQDTEGLEVLVEGKQVTVTTAANFVGLFNITCNYTWTEGTVEQKGGSSNSLYKYPGTKTKVEETEDNETIIEEPELEDQEVIVESEEESYVGVLVLIGILIGLIIIVIWFFVKKNQN